MTQRNESLSRRESLIPHEAEDFSSYSGSGEQETLLPHPHTTETATVSSTSNQLLAIVGPAVLAGIIVKAFDIAFLLTSYSRLASDLQHFKDASWIMLTASICSAIFVPLYSYLLKALGIRRMMLAAYSAFALGLGLCTISISFWQLLSSRFIVGLGSSGITLLSMIVINEIVGMKHLAIWESFVTCVEMGTSMTAGPLGASIYRHFTWHSVFFLELIMTLFAIAMLYFSFAKISSYPQHSESELLKKGDSKVPRLDIEGWMLLILAVTIPLIALTLGDNFLDWTHPVEILLLICGPIFMCIFVLFEAKVAAAPIIDITPIFKLEYLRVLLQVFGVISILNMIVFIIPPYAQVRAFKEPSFEDWALTCIFLGFLVGAILGGYLIKADIFHVQRIMLVNAVLLQCFCVLFATRLIQPESVHSSPLLAVFGVCTGIWQSCLLYATLLSTQKQWWPQTLALYYLVETFGADLGMAMMSTITRSVAKLGIRLSLGNSDATEQIIVDSMKDLKSVRFLNKGQREKVLAAFEHAMHVSLFLPCAVAAVVILLAASMNLFNRKAGYEEVASGDHGDGAI